MAVPADRDRPTVTAEREALARTNGAPGACGACAMNPLCFARAAQGATPPVESRRRLAAGEPLYRNGNGRDAIHAVRAGFLKVCEPDGAGGTHLMRFLLPGDVAGLDSLAGGTPRGELIALGDCELCEIPAYRAGILADFSPAIGAQLRSLLGRELVETRAHAASVAHLTASARVALFLLDLSRRWGERGFSVRAFGLPMGRREIGEHLGLTMETVSRILNELRVTGVIALPRGGVEILDLERLRLSARSPAAPPG